MRKLLLIILISSSGICLIAQTNLDFLYTVWLDGSQSDSIRTVAFRDYVKEGFLNSDPDSVLILADELIEFGKNRNYPIAQASAFRLKGEASSEKRDYLQALQYHKEELKIYEHLSDQDGIAKSLIRIGYLYGLQDDYPKALDHYTRSVEIMEKLGDQDGIPNSLLWIGYIYYQAQGDLPKALDYYNRSLKMSEQLGNQKGIADALYGIGIVYKGQGALAKALECQTQSLKIHEQLEDQRGISGSLIAIGNIYKEQGELTRALDLYIRSLKIREELGDPQRIPLALNYIGTLYLLMGDHAKALDYCQKSYQLTSSIGMLPPQITACGCLYDTYKAIGNESKALEYLELKVVLDDSLNAEETAKKIQQLEFAKQILADSLAQEEEDLRVQLAHQQEVAKKEKTRNWALVSGGFLLLLAIGLYSRVRYVRKAKARVEKERDRSDNLLLNILPAEIAEELKEKGESKARDFDMVSILFTDFKGFTKASENLSAVDLVAEINTCFKAFDGIVGKYNIEKIKTIGDAYMCAGGLPLPTDDSVKNTVLAALEMQEFISKRKADLDAEGKPGFEMRAGVHIGPIVAGIVGMKKFQYDIWGDTVNTASRMESSGEVGKVNISQDTYELLKDDKEFTFESRGKIMAKGKGKIGMYFVSKT